MNIRPEIAGVWDYLYWNLAKIFIAGKSSIGSGPLWFVFTLYSVSLMFYGVMVITKRIELWIPSLRSRMTVAGIAIASLIAGWLLYKNHIRLPLGIERDLTVLFFFTCGWICREPIKNLSKDSFGHRPRSDTQYTALQRCSVTLLTAGIAGLIATFIVADKLTNIAPIRIAKGILRNISRNALVILAVHWWILLVLRIIFKSELDKPGTAFLSTLIVTVGITITIPNKPYHPRPTCD